MIGGAARKPSNRNGVVGGRRVRLVRAFLASLNGVILGLKAAIWRRGGAVERRGKKGRRMRGMRVCRHPRCASLLLRRAFAALHLRSQRRRGLGGHLVLLGFARFLVAADLPFCHCRNPFMLLGDHNLLIRAGKQGLFWAAVSLSHLPCATRAGRQDGGVCNWRNAAYIGHNEAASLAVYPPGFRAPEVSYE